MHWKVEVFPLRLTSLEEDLEAANGALFGRRILYSRFIPQKDVGGGPILYLLAAFGENAFAPAPGRANKRGVAPGSLVAPKRRMDELETRIFLELLRRRFQIARENGYMECMLGLDEELKALAVYKPRHLWHLKKIKGFGPWRRKACGQAFVEAVNSFLEPLSAEEAINMPWPLAEEPLQAKTEPGEKDFLGNGSVEAESGRRDFLGNGQTYIGDGRKGGSRRKRRSMGGLIRVVRRKKPMTREEFFFWRKAFAEPGKELSVSALAFLARLQRRKEG